MIKLSPNIVLSNHYAKGSIKSRIKRSEKLNSIIFKEIIPLFEKKNSCYFFDLKSRYTSSIPENKPVQIVPIKQSVFFEEDGYIMLNNDVESANHYILGIEARKKGKKDNIPIKNLPDFMHESTHILDYMLNPKYLVNLMKMEKMGIFDKPYFKIYDDLFYNSEHVGDFGLKNKLEILKRAETETRNILEKVPLDEKLTFLNFIKYSMQTEFNAYNQENKFVNLLKKTRNFASLKKYKNFNNYYHFPGKIDIVNKLIRETLAETRKSLA